MRIPEIKRQAGVTLVELMVALLIGTILLLALVQVFAASRTAYATAEGMGRVQENARFAMDYLQRDIRMAGHFGCVNDQAHMVKNEGDPAGHFTPTVTTLNFARSIEGIEAPDSAPRDSIILDDTWGVLASAPVLDPQPVAGSDLIMLRYFSPEGVAVTGINGGRVSFDPAGADHLTGDGVANPDMFGVSDCLHADVFPGTFDGPRGEAVMTSGVTALARYNFDPGAQTRLYRANSIIYYVGLNDGGEPALHRARADRNGTYTSEELVEGIESLQILYGQDTTAVISATSPPVGSATEYGTADTLLAGSATADAVANEWRRVALVEVGILARSPQRASAPPPESAISVLGTLFDVGDTYDGRYRASYETTIALRNRLFGN